MQEPDLLCTVALIEFSFFDPSDPQCRAVLLDPGTSVPELFAVLRQWVPQVQKNISLIGSEVRGHPSPSLFSLPPRSQNRDQFGTSSHTGKHILRTQRMLGTERGQIRDCFGFK